MVWKLDLNKNSLNFIIHQVFNIKLWERASFTMFENHSFSTYAKFSGRLIFLKPWYAHVFQFRTKYWVLLIIEKVWSNYLKVFDLPLNITWNKISFQKIIPEVKLPLKQFFRWTYLANGLLAVKKFFVLPSDEVPALFSPKEKFNVLFFKHNEAPGLHGRNRARNVHANRVTRTRKFVRAIDSSV